MSITQHDRLKIPGTKPTRDPGLHDELVARMLGAANEPAAMAALLYWLQQRLGLPASSVLSRSVARKAAALYLSELEREARLVRIGELATRIAATPARIVPRTHARRPSAKQPEAGNA